MLTISKQSNFLSSHYARLLANLAHQRGFDGYLLNFECNLRGGVEQAKALSAWIMLLQRELRKIVGPHAQATWYVTLSTNYEHIHEDHCDRYDSVTVLGHLRWQDRLNSLNLPFFLSSSAFFTNYTVSTATFQFPWPISTRLAVANPLPNPQCSVFPKFR